jgi:6-phosphogluconate dehydrogenase
MVHNGIEYADMQLLAELYAILKRLYPKDRAAVQKAFHQLNQLHDYIFPFIGIPIT